MGESFTMTNCMGLRRRSTGGGGARGVELAAWFLAYTHTLDGRVLHYDTLFGVEEKKQGGGKRRGRAGSLGRKAIAGSFGG